MFLFHAFCIALPILSILSVPEICLYNDTLDTESQAQLNVPRLRQLRKGMTEEEVRQVMEGVPPVSTEQLILDDDEEYDVWFYVTKGTALDQGNLLSRNLTPVIFKNGILVGIGQRYYKKVLLKQQEKSQRIPAKESEREPAEGKILEMSNKTSMCSKPVKIAQKEKGQQPDEDQEEEKEPKSLDVKPEDRRIWEDEQEENFDQW